MHKRVVRRKSRNSIITVSYTHLRVVAETDILRFALRRNNSFKMVPLPPPEGDETTTSSPLFFIGNIPFFSVIYTFGASASTGSSAFSPVLKRFATVSSCKAESTTWSLSMMMTVRVFLPHVASIKAPRSLESCTMRLIGADSCLLYTSRCV